MFKKSLYGSNPVQRPEFSVILKRLYIFLVEANEFTISEGQLEMILSVVDCLSFQKYTLHDVYLRKEGRKIIWYLYQENTESERVESGIQKKISAKQSTFPIQIKEILSSYTRSKRLGNRFTFFISAFKAEGV